MHVVKINGETPLTANSVKLPYLSLSQSAHVY